MRGVKNLHTFCTASLAVSAPYFRAISIIKAVCWLNITCMHQDDCSPCQAKEHIVFLTSQELMPQT